MPRQKKEKQTRGGIEWTEGSRAEVFFTSQACGPVAVKEHIHCSSSCNLPYDLNPPSLSTDPIRAMGQWVSEDAAAPPFHHHQPTALGKKNRRTRTDVLGRREREARRV